MERYTVAQHVADSMRETIINLKVAQRIYLYLAMAETDDERRKLYDARSQRIASAIATLQEDGWRE